MPHAVATTVAFRHGAFARASYAATPTTPVTTVGQSEESDPVYILTFRGTF